MVAGAHAHKFFRDVAKTNSVWTVGLGDNPVTVESNGVRVQPLWSSRSRVVKIIANVKAYSGCTVLGIKWNELERLWLDLLVQDGVLLGLNWSGPSANGYEMPASLVAQSVKAARDAAA